MGEKLRLTVKVQFCHYVFYATNIMWNICKILDASLVHGIHRLPAFLESGPGDIESSWEMSDGQLTNYI